MEKLRVLEHFVEKQSYVYKDYFSNIFLIVFFFIILLLSAIFFINVILFDPNQSTSELISNLRDYNFLTFE